jgi:hypothetical protein
MDVAAAAEPTLPVGRPLAQMQRVTAAVVQNHQLLAHL